MTIFFGWDPGNRPISQFLRVILFVLGPLTATGALAAPTLSFDIRRGAAVVALKDFASQSREQLLYSTEALAGVVTNPVKGEMTARDALDRMLTGTGFVARQDEQTRAYSVRRVPPDPNAPRAAPARAAGDRPHPLELEQNVDVENPQKRMKRTNLFVLLGSWLAVTLAHAQPSSAPEGVGSVSGRVFNPSTGEYVRNVEVRVDGTPLVAISEEGGYYRLTQVPAGEAGLVATYSGFVDARAQVQVRPGTSSIQNFELHPRGFRSEARETVKMEAFVVSTELAGQAKAIAEQKNAMNVKTVVAADSFGDIFEGNVGEFLKYMPGITLDYVETDTRAARIGGLEAQYGYVTLDGGTMASTNSLAGGFRDNARSFEFEAVSINNIESIEVNKTLSADMPGDAPAGTINLRTKSALDRKGQRFSFAVAMVGNEYEYTLKRTPRPDDAKHAKIRPTLSFDYSTALFNNKLGVAVNGSFTNVFKEQFRVTHVYDYTSAQAVAFGRPLVNAITYKDGPKLTDKMSGGLKVDYEPFPALRLSMTSSYTAFADEMSNRTIQFRGVGNLGPDSSLTQMVALPSGNNANTRLATAGKYSVKRSDTTNFSLGFTYKKERLTVDGLASYSRARFRNGAEQHQTVDSANLQLTRIGFIAERSSPDSTDWSFTQTHGADWNDLSNWGRNDPLASNIDSQYSVAKTEEYVAQINVKYAVDWKWPTFFKTGLHKQVSTRMRHYNKFLYTKTYVGPTGNQLDAVMPLSSADVRISQAWGGNLWSLPAIDREAVWDLHQAHPEYFTASAAQQGSDLEQMLANPQSNQEQVDSAYIMQNTRIGKLQIQGGIRYENTHTYTKVKAAVPVRENPFARVTTNPTTGVTTYAALNTPDYVTYKWSAPPVKNWGAYDNFLPSISAKYPITPDLILKLGYNKATKRPRLDYMAGGWIINSADTLITIPNPGLTPERSDKVSAMLEYYFEPLGTFGVHLFRTAIKGASDRIGPVPSSEVGLGDDPVYSEYEFITFTNVEGTRVIKGIELNYSQQLTFLPSEWLRGISVFATYSRFNSHDRPANFIPQNATGGFSWRYRRFNAGISGTWNDEFRTGAQIVAANSLFFPNEPEYMKERFLFDVNAGFQITRHTSLFVAVRDAFNSGRVWYYKGGNRIRQMERFGAQWSIGVKGNF